MVAIFRCRSMLIRASGPYRSGLSMRAFLLTRSTSLVIPKPCPRLGDGTTASNPSEVLGQHDYEVLTRAAPPQLRVDRCTLTIR